jgi:hypothetical protein
MISTPSRSAKLILAGMGGLCAILQALPPTERSIWARKKLTRSGTALPTPPQFEWSQNPRTFTDSEFRSSPLSASNSTVRMPVVKLTVSTTKPALLTTCTWMV